MNVVRAFNQLISYWDVLDFLEKTTPYFENREKALKTDVRAYIFNKADSLNAGEKLTFEDFLKNWETLTDPSWWKFSGNPILLDEIDTIKRELLEEKVDYSSDRGFNWLFRHYLELLGDPDRAVKNLKISYEKILSAYLGRGFVETYGDFWKASFDHLGKGVFDSSLLYAVSYFKSRDTETNKMFFDHLYFKNGTDELPLEILDEFIKGVNKRSSSDGKEVIFKPLIESPRIKKNKHYDDWVQHLAPEIDDVKAGIKLYECDPNIGIAKQKIPGVFFRIIYSGKPASELNILLETWEKENKQILAQNARSLLLYGASKMIPDRMGDFRMLIETLMNNFIFMESNKTGVLYGTFSNAKNIFLREAVVNHEIQTQLLNKKTPYVTILDCVEYLWGKIPSSEKTPYVTILDCVEYPWDHFQKGFIIESQEKSFKKLVDTIKKWHEKFASDLPLRAADYK